MYLIERLEADRQCVEEALHKERRRRSVLVSKVDSFALWKQREHALAVQKGLRQRLHHAGFHDRNNESNAVSPFFYILFFPQEHEACMRDVTELKRQLALDGDQLDQAQEKLSRAEALNQRLHQDISCANTQIPLVKESLELQKGIVARIRAAQAEVRHVASQQTGFGFSSPLGHIFCSGLLLNLSSFSKILAWFSVFLVVLWPTLLSLKLSKCQRFLTSWRSESHSQADN